MRPMLGEETGEKMLDYLKIKIFDKDIFDTHVNICLINH